MTFARFVNDADVCGPVLWLRPRDAIDLADDQANFVAHDARADLARMVELGTIVHGSRGTAHGAVEGRFMIDTVHRQRPWIVIVEPDVDAKLLVVVTPYEVCE